jgi:hypothetical protein
MKDEITKSDVNKARQALAKLAELEVKIQRNKACGIDCADLEERCQQAKGFLTQFNTIFGPIAYNQSS